MLCKCVCVCKPYLQGEHSQGRNGYEGGHEERGHVVNGCQSNAGAAAAQAVSRPLLQNQTQISLRGERDEIEGGGDERRLKDTLKGTSLPPSVKEWANRNMSSTPIPNARKGNT